MQRPFRIEFAYGLRQTVIMQLAFFVILGVLGFLVDKFYLKFEAKLTPSSTAVQASLEDLPQ